VRQWIAGAKEAFATGRLREAQDLLQRARSLAPNHPLVLNDNALRLLQSGNPRGAAEVLASTIATGAVSSEVWLTYAMALRRTKKLDDEVATLEALLNHEPRNATALLEKGGIEEELQKPRAAAMTYKALLGIIPPGFKAPHWMEQGLEHARKVLDENNQALEKVIEADLGSLRERFTDVHLSRFDRCVEILLQKRRIWRQQPAAMQYPELPAIEFYERDDFPWLDKLEAAADDIRAELLSVIEEDSGLEPYIKDPPPLALEACRSLNHSRRWSAYFFWQQGKPFHDHMARCPLTTEALAAWPRWDVPGVGPTAMFSVLDAKTGIPAHTGPVNTRLVAHLPLIVPPGCGFRVGAQTREWVEGKAFVFDDTIEHQAWNDSDAPRAVMIIDLWSPFLSDGERELIRALTSSIDKFYDVRPIGYNG
jgi:aspartyl/asparaginyl beta-hydroxylase (cupin superfamily)